MLRRTRVPSTELRETAMVAGLPYAGVRDAIYTHPTMAEGLNDVFESVPPPA